MTLPPESAGSARGQARCIRVVRGIPCPGTLRIQGERLRFDPAGVVGSVVHGAPLEVPLSDIDAIDPGGLGGGLRITAGDATFAFRGPGARALADVLRAAVSEAAEPPATPVIPLFGAPATPLVRGEGTLFVSRWVSVGGVVSLSPTTLSFVPRSRVESWLFGDATLDLPVDELEAMELRGVRPVMVVRCRRRTWRFGGATAPALCGAIHILQGGPFRETLPPGEREVVVDTWPARLDTPGHSGAGTLVVGSHRLVFVPHSGTGAGGGLIEIPLAEVTRVAATAGSTRLLELWRGSHRTVLHLAHSRERARELGRVLLAVRTRDEPAVLRNGTVDSECFDAMLDAWIEAGRVPPGSASERTLVAGAVLHWPEPHAARRGWLGATSERAIFLPAGAVDGPEAPHIRADLVAQPEDTDGERSIVLGQGPDDRLIPRGGRLYVDAFWAAWRAQHPGGTSGVTERVQTELRPLLGTSLFVQLVDRDEALVTLPYAHMEQEGNILSLGFQGTPDRLLDVGRRVTVHVGKVEGMFQVETRVRGVRGHDDGRMQILLEVVSAVTQVERRTGFRVRASEEVDLYVLEQRRGSWVVAEAVPDCTLDDLSIVGCGVWVPRGLPQDARLRLTLPLVDGTLDVVVSIARFERPRTLRGAWRYGLRFARLPEASRDRIHADILARQRAEALRKLEGDEE